MRNLMARMARRHGGFIATCAILLGAFEFLLCAIISKLNVSSVLAQIIDQLPAPVRTMAATRLFAGFTPRGMLSFGWNHPLAQALGLALAISLGARAIAGEIGNGTMELVLAQPISRRRYLAGTVICGLLALAAVSLSGIAGTITGGLAFGLDPLPAPVLARLLLNFFLLQGAWFGIALTISSWGRDGGAAASAGFVLAVGSYLLEVIAGLWQPATFLLPLSLYHYYAPQEILVEGRLSPSFLIVLATVALLGVAAAGWRFERRDIP